MKQILFPLSLCLAALGLSACNSSSDSSSATAPGNAVAGPTADCGPGSTPETDIQGRVSQADHDSGRAALGFTCNTELVGAYTVPNAVSSVAGYKVERYVDEGGNECAYYDSTLLFPTNVLSLNAGVNVLDMNDPANPVLATRLTTPAMVSPHESLIVSQQAGVLAAVQGNPVFYPGVVDVYDLSEDCRAPLVQSSAPVGRLGHESGISPDGKTFYSSTPGAQTLTAVDISDPRLPVPVWLGDYSSHGLSISNDGNRAYLAAGNNHGVLILDVSEIQTRELDPQVREIASLSWPNQSIPQNAIPFTRDGASYLLEIDEFATSVPGDGSTVAAHGPIVGAARIIDISNEQTPEVISELRLQVHQAEHREAIADDPGAQDLTGGYAGHYCDVPTRVAPDIAACSMILSGLRIFDIRDPRNPREVAYFNAPLPVDDGGSNKAMSKPAFVPERKEIWYTDANSGLYVVRVTNGVW